MVFNANDEIRIDYVSNEVRFMGCFDAKAKAYVSINFKLVYKSTLIKFYLLMVTLLILD